MCDIICNELSCYHLLNLHLNKRDIMKCVDNLLVSLQEVKKHLSTFVNTK